MVGEADIYGTGTPHPINVSLPCHPGIFRRRVIMSIVRMESEMKTAVDLSY